MRARFQKFRFIHGLAFRYSLFFLLAILIILFFPLITAYRTSSALMYNNAMKAATILTQQTVAKFENVLQPTELIPQTLARTMEDQKTDYAEIMKLATDFVRQDTIVFGTCLAFEPYFYRENSYWHASYTFEKDDRLSARILGSKDYDYFKMDWYRLPKMLGTPVWTEPYFDKGGGDTLMCTYSVPAYRVIRGRRTFIGVLTMDVSLSGFERIVKGVNIFRSGYGFLVSRGGKIIGSPNSSMNNQNIIEIARAGKGKETQKAIREMIAGQSGFKAMDGLGMKKFPSFLSYAPVKNTGWSFGIIFPEAELYDDLHLFLKRMSWMFGISILVLLASTVAITGKMTRPLVHLAGAARMIGQGEFNARLPLRRSKDEVSQLTSAFAVMQEQLSNFTRNLQETTMAKEKIESELNVAHQIQMGMLPRGFTTPECWDLFATLDPARAVGGDLYDFFYLGPDQLCIAIGDVAGKGVPASLFMMVTRTLLRAKAVAGTPINIVMESINRELCKENTNQMFVTFFAGIVDLRTGNLEFCNAGHNYPYILGSPGMIRQLNIRNGIPLGIFGSASYSLGTYRFSQGETLVLATDGITEALNASNDFFGEAKLSALLSELAHKSSRTLTELLIGEIKRFSGDAEQADDITILTLQYKRKEDNDDLVPQNIRLELPNRVTELKTLVQKIRDISEAWNLPDKTVADLNLILEELFTNIVFYAYHDKAPHSITVELNLINAHTLQLRIEDDGRPFNLLDFQAGDSLDKPVDQREIGGLGIHLVKKLAEDIQYERAGDRNIVLLTKRF